MRLHENRELFSDALQAASQPVEDGGLGIKSIFIEKDYWICRSLSLMAANDNDNRAIFKGGTSLTKALVSVVDSQKTSILLSLRHGRSAAIN